MSKYLFIIFLFFTTKAVSQSVGFKGALDSLFVEYANKYPSEIYVVNATRLGGVDLFSIRTEPAYDKQTVAKYFIYKRQLVVYTATDSIERSGYVNDQYCQNFKDTISGYPSSFCGNYDPTSPCLFYVAVSPRKMIPIENYTEIPNFHHTKAIDRNGIRSNTLNKLLNDFINSYYAPIYEIRFNKYQEKLYVSFAANDYYDKTKIDAYFYRNGHLVTLYFLDTVKSLNLFNEKEITSFNIGIKNYKSKIRNEVEWFTPYPQRFILKQKNKKFIFRPLKNKEHPLLF